MYHAVHSDAYQTDYLSWPDCISPRCDVCGKPVKFAHADNGKIIQTLEGDIHQVVYYYTCSNEKCANAGRYFNPAPRYDYSQNHLGKDVLNRISREIFVFKQNPEQIHLRLTLDYGMNISLRRVERIYNDCIMVKAGRIDQQTHECYKDHKGLVVAIDGQDPGGGLEEIWLFTDAYGGRLLKTVLTSSMQAEKIKAYIDEISSEYRLPLLGVVSDKQNNLVRCMRDFFPGIPHQYCTWHFTLHLWEHLVTFDTQIYTRLKKTIVGLYIHAVNSTKTAVFEGFGSLPIREVFSAIDADLQRLLGYRSKKFEFLRGLALYRSLKRYVSDMEKASDGLRSDSRFGKIYRRTIGELTTAITEVTSAFFEDLFMYDMFKLVYRLIYAPLLERVNRQQQLDDIFAKCWAVALNKDPALSMENLRTFNTSAQSLCPAILGEWVRLWNSYLPGLFEYYKFPSDIRTNVAQERAFSQEKTALIRRMANKQVAYIQELQGEFYLRLSYCTQEERLQELVNDYISTEIQVLREAYSQKTKKIMEKWFYRAEPMKGHEETISKYWGTRNSLNENKKWDGKKPSRAEILRRKVKNRESEKKGD